MNKKIRIQHKEKIAYIYLRQSTMGQVKLHQESTQRQYALKDKALQLGWDPSLIRIIDLDLGISGSQISNREGFKSIVADVSMSKVGAIFALEASRLSRSCSDWHRLLELCVMTETLIIDEDGCYDPSDFNDQLLLNLKGTMSQAELHFIRGRLLGGKLNKAKKGTLRMKLPVGFIHTHEGMIHFDEDEQVRNSVTLLFSTFRQLASANAVAANFNKQNIKFPTRISDGNFGGKLTWQKLRTSRVLAIIKNPCYMGDYVYGRLQSKKVLLADGNFKTKVKLKPCSEWRVHIKDHHEGYISREEFMQNQKILDRNYLHQLTDPTVASARKGKALLQGMLFCGICGRKLAVRYSGKRSNNPSYVCSGQRYFGNAKVCLQAPASSLDELISLRVLDVLKPNQIKIALAAVSEIEKRDKALSKQWALSMDRANYEVQIAQKRYEEVDPSNRLVASTLEKRWNDALVNLEKTKQEFETFKSKHLIIATPDQKTKIEKLANDLPKLWNANTTQNQDRKRILRLLINDITIKRKSDIVLLHIRWRGGATDSIHVDVNKKYRDQHLYSEEFIETLRKLSKTHNNHEILSELNKIGFKTKKKSKPLSIRIIREIRRRHNIPKYSLKRSEEVTIKDLTQKFGISYYVVKKWIYQKKLKARRIDLKGYPWWITLSDKDNYSIKKWVSELASNANLSPNNLLKTTGGAS